MKQVFLINENGFIVDKPIIDEDAELTDNMIEMSFPISLYKPRWNGSDWVEGATESEVEKIQEQLPEKVIENLQYENHLLKQQNKALVERADFQEELIVELAMMVYP